MRVAFATHADYLRHGPMPMFPRCQVVPLPDEQVAVEIDGRQRLRWHFGERYRRPYFYPFVGPSGSSLTRMGHPGAPNHDHHRSIWFGHAKVLGIDFWSENTPARIRQRQWLSYQDGDEEALLAVQLEWLDGHDPRPLIEQELVAAVRPGPENETFLELQATLRPQAQSLELGQTNFGLLAVRVASHISAHFGGGELTDSEGRRGEPAIFAKPANWMDYSGPAPTGGIEGITYFDHPGNPHHPAHWHVREDGWMGASLCLEQPLVLLREQPLVLRYLLHAHRGDLEAARASQIHQEFSKRGGFRVVKSTAKHRQYEIRMKDEG
jgi:hypothetical protein